jgi:hypothetical protein
MRASYPPVIATWLLDHLCAEPNDALAGDLVEEYFDGRSAGWYWRQVMAAIAIGGVQRVRACWSAVMFAALWTALSPGLRYLQIRMLDDDGAGMQRIWRMDGHWSTRFDSSVDVFAFLSVLWLGVTLYVVLDSSGRGEYQISRLVRGLLLVLPTLAAICVITALASAVIPAMLPGIFLSPVWGSSNEVPLLLRMAHGPYGMVFFATAIPLILTTARAGRSGKMAIRD